MAGWTKLMHSILHSTIWREPDHVRLVWITMLAMSDKDGIVEASVPGLADAARVGIEDCCNAIERLKSPDKWSRSTEHEGRRIEEVEGGWLLLNHGKYRGLIVAEKKKAYNRVRQQEWRARHKSVTKDNAVTPRNAHQIPDPDPDPKSDPDPKAVKKSTSLRKEPKGPAKSTKTWEAYSLAYELRYGTAPVRNAKQNSLCCQLVDRLGADVAPAVAQHYLSSQNAYYATRGHALGILLADAEKVHMEWKTGTQITQAEARERDRLAKDGAEWQAIIDKRGKK